MIQKKKSISSSLQHESHQSIGPPFVVPAKRPLDSDLVNAKFGNVDVKILQHAERVHEKLGALW